MKVEHKLASIGIFSLTRTHRLGAHSRPHLALSRRDETGSPARCLIKIIVVPALSHPTGTRTLLYSPSPCRSARLPTCTARLVSQIGSVDTNKGVRREGDLLVLTQHLKHGRAPVSSSPPPSSHICSLAAHGSSHSPLDGSTRYFKSGLVTYIIEHSCCHHHHHHPLPSFPPFSHSSSSNSRIKRKRFSFGIY